MFQDPTAVTSQDLLSRIKERLAGLVMWAGGPGSGNFGHSGRPGEVGGSAPGDSDRMGLTRQQKWQRDYEKRQEEKRLLKEQRTKVKREAAKEQRQIHHDKVMEIAKKTLTELGVTYQVPVRAVKVSGPRFRVGARVYSTAAEYDNKDHTIKIFAPEFSVSAYGEQELRGTIAHEVTHAMFHSLERDYEDELRYISWRKEREHPLDEKGQLKKEQYAQYPVVARFGAILDTTRGTSIVPVDPEYIQRLIADDGVSDYSTAYWDAYKSKAAHPELDFDWSQKSSTRLAFVRAVNETFAEIAKRELFTGTTDAAGPTMRALYEDFKAHARKSMYLSEPQPHKLAAAAAKPEIVGLSKDWKIVPLERAYMLKIYKADGSVAFAFRIEE